VTDVGDSILRRNLSYPGVEIPDVELTRLGDHGQHRSIA